MGRYRERIVPESRKQALRHLAARASAKYMPRLFMFAIMSIVLGVIYFSSWLLLSHGIETMWLRYIAADAIGYAVFILLLWLWVHFEGGDWLDAGDIPAGPDGAGDCAAPLGDAAGQGAAHAAADGGSIFDIFGFFADAEGAAFLLALAVAAAVIFLIAYNVWLAPEILAELMLDAGLAAVLSKRALRIKPEGFLSSAFRQTLPPFAGFAAVMVVVACIIGHNWPEAHSLGEAIHLWRNAPR